MPNAKQIERSYRLAQERYAEIGVDTDHALAQLAKIPISLHCWQGDDITGFENSSAELTNSGLAITGNYPGKARTPTELRADAEKALSLIPGQHRFNLHACYAEFDPHKKVDRDALQPHHFQNWIDWAKKLHIGLDFNPTCFAHPLAASGFTLSHHDKSIRQFWIHHCQASRKIGAAIGKALHSPTVTNLWIPDGMKDTPADRRSPREHLNNSLDQIFSHPQNPKHNLDALEGKLFGIGSESFTTGSHDFYLAYAVKHQKLLTLDAGHFHPTESLADKISSVLTFLPKILLHLSRGVRWDSDHVVTLTDDLLAITHELVRNNYLSRTHIGLDYFDASINRIAAWVIGSRNTLRALLIALLEPVSHLQQLENANDYTSRLTLMEEAKSLPSSAVWDHYCHTQNVPVGQSWLPEIKRHEHDVLSKRS